MDPASRRWRTTSFVLSSLTSPETGMKCLRLNDAICCFNVRRRARRRRGPALWPGEGNIWGTLRKDKPEKSWDSNGYADSEKNYDGSQHGYARSQQVK